VAEPDLARERGRAQQRARAQLAREPHHRLRGAFADAERLATVVAQAREAEGDEPVAARERREPFADGDLERALHAGDLREEPLARIGVGLAGVDERAELRGRTRLERGRGRGDLPRAAARADHVEALQARVHRTDLATAVRHRGAGR